MCLRDVKLILVEGGAVRCEATAKQVRNVIVGDVAADRAARPDGSRLVLAHRHADVQAINDVIRAVCKSPGELADERFYQTSAGKRAFAAGDGLLLREQQLRSWREQRHARRGKGRKASACRAAAHCAATPGPGGSVAGKHGLSSMADYAAADRGYATTIHNAQGATVDRVFIFAYGAVGRHLAYVA